MKFLTWTVSSIGDHGIWIASSSGNVSSLRRSCGTNLWLLRSPSWCGTNRSDLRSKEAIWLWDGRHKVPTGISWEEGLSHLLHAHICHALHVLRCQVCLTVLLALCQGNVQWLASADATIHFSDSLGSFFGRWETHETESLGATIFQHDFGGCDSTELREFFA